MEIRKPLVKEDYGAWRIYLPLSVSDYTGCVFNVKSQLDDANALRVPPPAKLIEVFHDPRSSGTTTTELSCEATYPIDYCYLSGPQGGNFAPESFDRLKTLGICQFKVLNITAGMWACGFNDANGGEDRMSYFDLKVYEQPGKTITPQTKASKGDEGKRLLCKTILELPIEICRFVSPNGEVHGLSESIVPGDGTRFRYFGEGLRAGECGMEITEVEREDFGWWKCAIKVQGKDYAIGMELIEEGEVRVVMLSGQYRVGFMFSFVFFRSSYEHGSDRGHFRHRNHSCVCCRRLLRVQEVQQTTFALSVRHWAFDGWFVSYFERRLDGPLCVSTELCEIFKSLRVMFVLKSLFPASHFVVLYFNKLK